MKLLLAVSALTLGVASTAVAQAGSGHASPAPAVHVKMMMQGSHYMFDPANFTIHQGDVVEFDNVSGFPHNVSFDPSKIPAGAASVLNAAMANRTGNLQGPMFTQAGQKYLISFAGAPTGTYDYFCLPHRPMGMKGTITVVAARGHAAARH